MNIQTIFALLHGVCVSNLCSHGFVFEMLAHNFKKILYYKFTLFTLFTKG